MTLHELTEALREGGIDNAAGEARELFLHFGGFPPAALVGQDPSLCDPRLSDALTRRLAHEPLQYILGECAFFRETYDVSPDCLIPRADTELLVEQAIALLPRDGCFADLCTGSGCIAVSVLANRTDLRAHAYDISENALSLAERNALRNGVGDRVAFHASDLLREGITGTFDALLSNPPYIRTGIIDSLAPELAYEPRLALDGGEDGMMFYRAILNSCLGNLTPRGVILFEIGYDQAEAITALSRAYGLQADVLRDLGGNPRVAKLTRGGANA